MRVVTAEEMRRLDRKAMEEGHLSGAVLMENAGRAVVDVMERTLGPLAGKRVAVFCGGGNNGGDGVVIARHLYLRGARPHLLLLGNPERFGDEARTHFLALQKMPVPVLHLYDGPQTLGNATQGDKTGEILVPSPPDKQSGNNVTIKVADAERLAVLSVLDQVEYDFNNNINININNAGNSVGSDVSSDVDIVVDALLGTGAKGAPRGIYAAAIRWINNWHQGSTAPGNGAVDRQKRAVIAVDIPSGVDADTGEIAVEAVHATTTVTFAYPKAGHFLFPGAACVGSLHLNDIGFYWEGINNYRQHPSITQPTGQEIARETSNRAEQPSSDIAVVETTRNRDGRQGSYAEQGALRLFILPGNPLPGNPLLQTGFAPSAIRTDLPIRRLLAPRYPDANKGDYGHVGIVSGSQGMCGAPALVARAAQRAGAGLVTVLAPSSAQMVLAGKLDEQMTLPLPEEEGEASLAAFETIAAFARKATLLCIGPGLTTRPGTVALVQRLIAEVDCPIVLDADGLNALAQRPEIALQRPDNPLAPLVLTPHPGEAARLLGCSIPEIQADRIGAVRALAQRYRAIALLKGRYTLIASPQGDVIINTTGNPGMATGGAGDTLTGIIGGLLARQLEILKRREPARRNANNTIADAETVALGAYVHGLAADLAAQETGETALIAGDIIAHLGRALRLLEEAN